MSKLEHINERFQALHPGGYVADSGGRICACYQSGGRLYWFARGQSLDSIARKLGLPVPPRRVNPALLTPDTYDDPTGEWSTFAQ